MTEQDKNAETAAAIEATFNTTVHYIANYGDWVRLADGTPCTVIHAQPCWDATRKRSGVSYTVMLKGGHERSYAHYDGDDHLTRERFYGPNSTEQTEPLFTVVNDD